MSINTPSENQVAFNKRTDTRITMLLLAINMDQGIFLSCSSAHTTWNVILYKLNLHSVIVCHKIFFRILHALNKAFNNHIYLQCSEDLRTFMYIGIISHPHLLSYTSLDLIEYNFSFYTRMKMLKMMFMSSYYMKLITAPVQYF